MPIRDGRLIVFASTSQTSLREGGGSPQGDSEGERRAVEEITRVVEGADPYGAAAGRCESKTGGHGVAKRHEQQ